MADDLPAVLELLHDSDRRWRTVAASRAELDAGPIIEVARKAETLWP